MLPKENRLPLRTSRRAVEAVSKANHSPYFTLLVASLPERTLLPSRFATILSKKISKLAVTRNLVRRQILSAIQEQLANTKPGFEVIILPKKAILEASFTQIKDEVRKTLQKSGLI